jgi:hypothetical protein
MLRQAGKGNVYELCKQAYAAIRKTLSYHRWNNGCPRTNLSIPPQKSPHRQAPRRHPDKEGEVYLLLPTRYQHINQHHPLPNPYSN